MENDFVEEEFDSLDYQSKMAEQLINIIYNEKEK
jgi:hypothetical protein